VKKRRLFSMPIVSLLGRAARFALRTQVFTIWIVLCAVGFVAGMQVRPPSDSIPYEEIFETMRVRSFRESRSDSVSRFVVELVAGGKVFREYDVDQAKFTEPVRGYDYRRSISGTRYSAMRVRGHVDRGFWLEMPTTSRTALLPEQFEEMYRTTLDFVKPISIVTNVLSVLSGYSVGYRFATWPASLAAPKVQERLLGTPGFGRALAREAWKRVLLEPALAAQESDAARFASTAGTHRVYTNFFKLAVSDSNGFISQEVARLDSAGCVSEARVMSAFARAVKCATQDSCVLRSADFSAIEDWADLLDRHGHWAYRSIPAGAAERMRYLGTLAWYGIAPRSSDDRRIWVGPRLMVRSGDIEGFVADEIPSIREGCPLAWIGWLRGDESHPSGNEWTAQWLAESRQMIPLVKFWTGIGRADERVAESSDPWEEEEESVERVPAADGDSTAHAATPVPAMGGVVGVTSSEPSSDSLWSEVSRLGRPASTDTTRGVPAATDTASGTSSTSTKSIRANVGGFGP
jgi:hypothetical protein